jgi:hypothetical protein
VVSDFCEAKIVSNHANVSAYPSIHFAHKIRKTLRASGGKKGSSLMKKYSILLVALLVATVAQGDSDNCCCETLGRSFMFTRPLNQQLSTDQAFRYELIHNKHGDMLSYVELIVSAQQSVPFQGCGRYFLPECKTELLVAGDDLEHDLLTRDIRAEWLGLPDGFHGNMSLNPEQRQLAGTLVYNQDLSKFGTTSLLRNAWVEITVPVITVENNLNLVQQNVTGAVPHTNAYGQPQPQDIIQAFRQPAWDFAKIEGQRSVIRLAEINLKVGKTYLSDEHFLISYYTMFSIPTGNEQNPAVLFDAVAGNNGHVGWGAGVNFQVLLNRDPSVYAACWFLNIQELFLIKNTQRRTLDLRDKPWSRYLQLVPKNGPVGYTVPGVNVLTREVHVHPYSYIDFSTGLRLQSAHAEFEVGYNIWGHGREKLCLACRFEPNYGIAGDQTLAECTSGFAFGSHAITASGSTIKERGQNDVNADGQCVFVPIGEHDLDMQSGATDGAINHKIHASLGFFSHGEKIDGLLGFGIFFDMPQRHTALQLIGGFAKCAAAF